MRSDLDNHLDIILYTFVIKIVLLYLDSDLAYGPIGGFCTFQTYLLLVHWTASLNSFSLAGWPWEPRNRQTGQLKTKRSWVCILAPNSRWIIFVKLFYLKRPKVSRGSKNFFQWRHLFREQGFASSLPSSSITLKLELRHDETICCKTFHRIIIHSD